MFFCFPFIFCFTTLLIHFHWYTLFISQTKFLKSIWLWLEAPSALQWVRLLLTHQWSKSQKETVIWSHCLHCFPFLDSLLCKGMHMSWKCYKMGVCCPVQARDPLFVLSSEALPIIISICLQWWLQWTVTLKSHPGGIQREALSPYAVVIAADKADGEQWECINLGPGLSSTLSH